MSDYHLRQATPDDADALVDMRLALQKHLEMRNPSIWKLREGGFRQLPQEVEQDLSDSATVILVACDSDDAPFAMLQGQIRDQPHQDPSRVGLIGLLFVQEPWRRQGVGRALVQRLCLFFSDENAEEISLRYVVGNWEAEEFWTTLGFQTRIVTANTTCEELAQHLE